jgi:hypothetical protein
MEELNEVCDTTLDVSKLYLIFNSLVLVYIKAYLELNEEYVSEANIEDLASDICFYALFDKQVQLNRKGKFFWWSFVSRVVKSQFALRFRAEREFLKQLNHLLTPEEPNLFQRTEKNFYKLTDTRVKELVLNGELLPTLQELQTENSELPEYLLVILKKKLKTISTEKLLRMYQILTKKYTKEHRTCREKVHQMFYRDRPRRV